MNAPDDMLHGAARRPEDDPADARLDALVRAALERERMPEGLAASTLAFVKAQAAEAAEGADPALDAVTGGAKGPMPETPAAGATTALKAGQTRPVDGPASDASGDSGDRPCLRLVDGFSSDGTGSAGVPPSGPHASPAPRRKARRRPPLRRFAQLLAACLVVGALAAGTFAYAGETAQVQLDGGATVELGLNRWGRVVRADASDDGLDALVDGLGLVGRSCPDALEALAGSAEVQQALDGSDGAVTLVATCANAAQLDATLADCEQAAAGFGHGSCCMAADAETAAAASEAGMGVARYAVYLQIAALDPDVSLDECSGMSMRALRDLLADLEAQAGVDGDGAAADDGCGTGGCPGGGHGRGRGGGSGMGAGRGMGHGASS